MLDFALYLLYALLAIAAVGAIVFSLLNIVSKPGGLVRAGIGIGALLVLFFLSYAISGSELTAEQRAIGLTESSAKLIGAALIMFYIALIGAIVALVFSEIIKAFK